MSLTFSGKRSTLGQNVSSSMMMRIVTLIATMASFAVVAANKPIAKMVSEQVVPGKTLGPQGVSEGKSETITSNYAIHLGVCTPVQPYSFTILDGSSSGRGVIGTIDTVTSVTIQWDGGEGGNYGIGGGGGTGTIEIVGDAEPNFFALEDSSSAPDNMIGWPFAYDDVEGSKVATVTCDIDTDVIVIIRDDSSFEVEVQVDETSDGQQVSTNVPAVGSLTGNAYGRGKSGRKLVRSPISLENANSNGIKIKHDPSELATGVAIIQGTFETEVGKSVQRSFIVTSNAPKVNPNIPTKKLNVKCCEYTDDGDVVLTVPNLSIPGEYVRVDIRVGLSLDDIPEAVNVVDTSAFLEGNEGTITVHGAWLKLALEEHGLTSSDNDSWDVAVKDLVVTDPEDGYRVVGRFGKQIPSGGGRRGRRLLASVPLTDEEREISNEMRMGRVPDEILERRRHLQEESATTSEGSMLRGSNSGTVDHSRNLQADTHKKILVHGYCSSGNPGPWPASHFTNAVVFNSLTQGSYSHNTFATSIAAFGDSLDGCGCIGHSQGGAACLHLYTYYWSCLDGGNLGGSRMIQSVGTPYQGTALAGSLASLGDIFGVGCGSQTDLTYNGASSWLSGIPTWARSQVHYYTTSFEDKWWRYDYCNLGSDLLLGDPEDGTTEKAYGQLSGGNNRGHTTKECHTTGMRDPPQYNNYSRNQNMNTNAQY